MKSRNIMKLIPFRAAARRVTDLTTDLVMRWASQSKLPLAWLWALLLTSLNPLALAGPGHDHGEAASPINGSALPRFAASSEELELVGILNGKQLTLYLDHSADNSPINGAEIEVDIAGHPYKAQKHGDGEYEVLLKETLKPGVIGVTAVVRAGNLNDLLAADLDLPQDDHDHGHQHSWRATFMWVGIGLIALLLMGAAVRSRQLTRRA
jgi:hypothetical protein